MNTPHFPPSLHWSAQELADAVPLRLSELITPALLDFGREPEAANSVVLSPWAFDWRRRDYVPVQPPGSFRVR